jgi:diguanylate cyclase (GGDEF)-like protein
MSTSAKEAELRDARDRDIARRVDRLAPVLSGSVFLTAASLWPLVGLRAAATLALLSIGFQSLDPDFPPLARWRAHRPGILVATALLAVACAITGGPHSPLVMLFAMPAVVACTHLRGRRLAVSLAGVEVAMLAVALTAGPAAIVAGPHLVVVPTVMLVMVSIVVTALASSDAEHRTAAALDPLTGMLNRHGLAGRFGELSAQAQRTGRPISVAIIDVDGFKGVNDEHGHGRGDAVLRAIASTITAHLRPFELAYRIGGDEFVIVLPGVSLEDAVGVAERMRTRVRGTRPGGLQLTLSIGVSSATGEDATYEALFAQADEALYRAKRAGRDRVEPSPASLAPHAAAA